MSQRLKTVISQVTESRWAKTDRHGLLRGVWESIAALPLTALGPEEGNDLCLLMVAQDRHGVGLSGVGLSGVWGIYAQECVAMVDGDHPLLSPAGRPETIPGVLTLDRIPQTVVGRPFHLDTPPNPVLQKLERDCGVRV